MKAENKEALYTLARVAGVAISTAILASAVTACLFYRPPKPVIHATYRVEYGDTIDGIARKASYLADRPEMVDVNQLSFNIQKDNAIHRPGDLKPGTLLDVNY